VKGGEREAVSKRREALWAIDKEAAARGCREGKEPQRRRTGLLFPLTEGPKAVGLYKGKTLHFEAAGLKLEALYSRTGANMKRETKGGKDSYSSLRKKGEENLKMKLLGSTNHSSGRSETIETRDVERSTNKVKGHLRVSKGTITEIKILCFE